MGKMQINAKELIAEWLKNPTEEIQIAFSFLMFEISTNKDLYDDLISILISEFERNQMLSVTNIYNYLIHNVSNIQIKDECCHLHGSKVEDNDMQLLLNIAEGISDPSALDFEVAYRLVNTSFILATLDFKYENIDEQLILHMMEATLKLGYSMGILDSIIFNISSVLDHLKEQTEKQFARNLAEHLLTKAYYYNYPSAGHFISTYCYSDQRSSIICGIYSILLIESSKKYPITVNAYYAFLISIAKLFRGCRVPVLQQRYNEVVKDLIPKSDRRARILDFTNLTGLVKEKSSGIHIKKFFDMYMDVIITNGECNQSLSLIDSYQKIHKTNEFEEERIKLLKYCDIEEYNARTYNYDADALYCDYIQDLDAIMNVIYASDMKYDVNLLSFMAGKLIRINNPKYDKFLLVLPFLCIDFFRYLNEDVIKEFGLIEAKVRMLKLLNADQLELIALIVSDAQLFVYKAYKEKESISLVNITYKELMESWKIFSHYKDECSYPDDEYERQLRCLKSAENLCYSKLDICSSDAIYILDPILGMLPSNILQLVNSKISLDSKLRISECISFDTKIMSEISLKSIEIWIPIETQDHELNYVYSHIEEYLRSKNICIHTSIEFTFCADICIAVVHGNESTYLTNNLSAASNTVDMISKLKKSRLVILMACYSGKGGSEIVGNSMSSLVSQLMKVGVFAVIAPKWALNVDIAHMWLAEFIEEFYSKRNSSFESFVNANQYIKKLKPHPGGWCCLHYFGKREIKYVG